VPGLVAINGALFGEPKLPFSTLVMAMCASALRAKVADVRSCSGGVGVVVKIWLTREERTAMACLVAVVFETRGSSRLQFAQFRQTLPERRRDAPYKRLTHKLYGSMQQVVLGPVVSGDQGPRHDLYSSR
jgi:hypothetical protein